MIDFEVLAELCGGMPAAVVARAREYLRVSTAKKALRVKESTPAACFIVACRSLDEPVDVKHLSRLVGLNARTVEQDVRRILGAVNVRSVIKATPASLCVRFGCTSIADRVTRVHAEYQRVAARLARTAGAAAPSFDPSDPIFLAACLFACSKRAKLRVDRAQLLTEMCAHPQAFDAIVASVEEHCEAALSGAVVARRPRDAGGGAASAAGGSGKRPLQPTTKAAQRAAKVLKKAADEHDRRQRERDGQPSTGTRGAELVRVADPDRYLAWRQSVLDARKAKRAAAERPERPQDETESTATAIQTT
ncbi:hypothetical protein ATCC90586_005702 [Pythium insidiosum]|nr:hypothetical protein ATCC90586_005702 [Pythium insidiosum]